MFTIRYSQTGTVVRWDDDSFTVCRPCEADGIADEIIELASSLTVPSTFYINGNQLPRSLHHSTASRKGLPSEWTLDEPNEKAKKVCLDALSKARDDDNLQHAKSLYDEYKKEGRLDENGEYAGLYDLENPKKKNSWDPEPEAISWGDETVTDEMCTTNEEMRMGH